VGSGQYFVLDASRKISLTVAVWILVILSLSNYYGIRIGRNVFGMAIGLLIFMGSELIRLAAIDLLPSWWGIWRPVHPIAYILMLMIWTSALWNDHPNAPVRSLDDAVARGFLLAWRDRWMQVPSLLRRVVKP